MNAVRVPIVFAALAAVAASPLYAQTGLSGARPSVSKDMPALIEAEQMGYDKESQVVIAAGHVTITQGDNILIADKVYYYQQSGRVRAEGNVAILEPSGHVLFAEEAELQNEMQTGVAEQFKARMSDNSLFAANEARRLNDTQTELTRAVYSPCAVVCDNGEPKTPLWQLKAEKALIDTEAQTVTYHDAWMEVWGVPILYSPYFSHATPGADNKTGILTPSYEHNSNLGTVVRAPIYVVLGQDKDLTFTPTYTSNEGMVWAGEYRQLFDSGKMEWAGSFTNPKDRDASGDLTAGRTERWHVDAKGKFKLDEDWNWGFQLRRASDDTYMRRYGFGWDTLLTTKAYLEGLNFVDDSERTYASMQAYSFQGLTAEDISRQSPTILPVLDFTYESDPLVYGSRFTLSGNAFSLYRSDGADSRRLSSTLNYMLPYVMDSGHIFEMNASMRVDAYQLEGVQITGEPNFTGTKGRLIPQVELGWRYPLINRFSNMSWVVEPIVNFAYSPKGGNSDYIANEDSKVPEFNDTNLFSSDRFAGYDRVEEGPRVNYGMRTDLNFGQNRSLNAMFGQNYQLQQSSAFPVSADPSHHRSDYVGRVGANFKELDVSYRFRLDRENLSPERSEVEANLYLDPVTLSSTYLKLNNDPILGSREEAVMGGAVQITKNWAMNAQARQDLEQSEPTAISIGLVFANECVNVISALGRNYMTDRDLKPDTSFRIQVQLKNLE